ncbi:MAG: TonB-dependent receptor [Bryobacterales bacterium]|nr:TonB-dependent receptor [Bryobacterales bacterium]
MLSACVISPLLFLTQSLAQETKSAQPPALEPVKTTITVTESIATEAPASVSIVGRPELQKVPGINLDDRLRSVPGFSLFRRTSSLVAHPTTQGVSLRGMGSSGASRSLVLWDGIPVNDPFGGWVYWTRIPPDEVERVEISRGASTSVFGDRAMSGAIALFSREPERHRLNGRFEAGNRNSQDVSAGFSEIWGRLGISGQGRAYQTDGYYIVPANRRGRIDTLAGVGFVTSVVRLDYFGGVNRLFLKTDILSETRKNGTPIQNNSTGLGNIALRFQRQSGNDSLSFAGFHTREAFRSGFATIAADRNSERVNFFQRVPAEAVGVTGVWQHRAGRFNTAAGGDALRVEGYSTDAFPTQRVVGGGPLLQHGVFGQADFKLGPVRFFAGGRHQFTGQDRTFFSPSTGFVVGRGRLRGRGSVYRSFRAPTLNELFRNFRAGNAETRANPALQPETVFGSEVGADWVGESTRVRVTGFRSSIGNIITNVTLLSTPAQIIRQRRNAASALSRGMEAEIQQRWRSFRFDAGYLFVDSRVATRERVPQIPKHQGSGQLAYDRNGTLASVGVRGYAFQFEEDLNQNKLPGFATVQAVLRQRLAKGFSAVAAFENLLDREYLTGKTAATIAIGAPRLWRVGLRWDGRR